MNKSCQNKLEKILSESPFQKNQQFICKNPYWGNEMILNYREASVYHYILEAFKRYKEAEVFGHNTKTIKAIRDYDKAREVMRFLNSEAYYALID